MFTVYLEYATSCIGCKFLTKNFRDNQTKYNYLCIEQEQVLKTNAGIRQNLKSVPKTNFQVAGE